MAAFGVPIEGLHTETGPGVYEAAILFSEALEAADLRVGFGLDPVEVDKTWHAELPIHWVLEAPNAGDRVPAETELVDVLPPAIGADGPAAAPVEADEPEAAEERKPRRRSRARSAEDDGEEAAAS